MRLVLSAFLALLLPCSAPAQTVHAQCTPPPNVEAIWSSPSSRFVLVGEVHGTRETPALFGELVCDAVSRGERVLVALEFPAQAAPAFATYFASDGGADAELLLLSESGWLDQAGRFPDGRTSEAMLELVRRLRALRETGASLALATFQPQMTIDGPALYEGEMAANIGAAASAGDFTRILVLVGNIHAMKAPWTSAGLTYQPMAMHLPADETLSLFAALGDGEVWNCSPECGVHASGGWPGGDAQGVLIGEAPMEGYDGMISVGPVTASSPVRR